MLKCPHCGGELRSTGRSPLDDYKCWGCERLFTAHEVLAWGEL